MENGKLMDFYFLLFPLSSSFSPRLTTYFAEAISSCFKKCSDGVLNYYWKLEIAVDGGRLELGYLKCKRNVFVHDCLLCAAAEANTESNVV